MHLIILVYFVAEIGWQEIVDKKLVDAKLKIDLKRSTCIPYNIGVIIMDRINNTRRKKVGSNLGEFKDIPDQASDTDAVFSKETGGSSYLLAKFREIWDYLGLLFSMLADSFNSKYPVPKKTVLVITFTLLYLISPIDFLPDLIPLLGFADDIALIAFAFSLIKDDIDNYRAWKMSY